MGAESFALAFLAGGLSILSPCVLPLLPIVLAGASGKHRFGPIALAAGLTFSFVLIGLFVALLGFSIGLDSAFFRQLGGYLLTAVGMVLLVPSLSGKLAVAAGPISGWIDQRAGRVSNLDGLGGQFAFGTILGAVWSPCVGPTLGAASLLAARGESVEQVALVMAIFGLGAGLPLAGIGLLSRDALSRWRGKLLRTGTVGKLILGSALLLTGVLVISGADRVLEAWLVKVSPEWLTNLTTLF